MSEEKNALVIYEEEKILENQVDDTAIELSKQIAKAENKNELDYSALLKTIEKINELKPLRRL